MTTPPEIPEAIVEKAIDAAPEVSEIREGFILNEQVIRAALEAAAPSLRAQGMIEACEMADKKFAEIIVKTPDLYNKPANYCTQQARARAAEIEGGKG